MVDLIGRILSLTLQPRFHRGNVAILNLFCKYYNGQRVHESSPLIPRGSVGNNCMISEPFFPYTFEALNIPERIIMISATGLITEHLSQTDTISINNHWSVLVEFIRPRWYPSKHYPKRTMLNFRHTEVCGRYSFLCVVSPN